VTATGSGTLSPGQRQAAHAAAHKLAGVLGAFGLTKGTGPAQEIERLYAAETPVSREDGPRLAGMAAVLRSLVESRKLRQSPGK
jgi:HPt (histidine-containing phosphotransfer) domain-containing protein